MNKIYIEISKLTDKFRKMAFGICKDENKINNAVQELMQVREKFRQCQSRSFDAFEKSLGANVFRQ